MTNKTQTCPRCGETESTTEPVYRNPFDVMQETIDRLRTELYKTMRGAAYESQKDRPMWAVVKDMTANGSTASARLCRELGINPDLAASDFAKTPFTAPVDQKR